MNVCSFALLVFACACTRAPAPPMSGAAVELASNAAPPAASVSAGALRPTASVSDDDGGARTAEARSDRDAAPDEVTEGKEFVAQARSLFRVAACGPSGEVPTRFDAAVVARHCEELERAYGDYRKAWIDVVKAFLAPLEPKDLPRVVVYPFGGGDLTSALATFPYATEITTISLEPAGDIRPIDTLTPERLGRELAEHRAHLERLFEKAHSRTDNLEKESKTELPGEVLFALAALVVHGAEPIGLRYFRLRPDGSLAYVTQADIDGAKNANDRRALFANAELRFVAGAPEAPVQTLRHVSFNLDDAHLKADPSLLAHLNAKGMVAVMTKAATHLLWSDHFGSLRDWLLAHSDWMISDSTGIPPRYAGPAGFVQDPYGTFNGPAPFGAPDARDGADVKKLFASQPVRELSFRYGYPDKDGHGHVIVTRRMPSDR